MYVVLWSFLVAPDKRSAFEQAYGPDGTWVNLFSKGTGYLGTELLFDGTRYMTIDRWDSEAAFRQFHREFDVEYRKLDLEFEKLTQEERSVGSFTTVDRGAP